jgi:hypothetical protein
MVAESKTNDEDNSNNVRHENSRTAECSITGTSSFREFIFHYYS